MPRICEVSANANSLVVNFEKRISNTPPLSKRLEESNLILILVHTGIDWL